MAVPDYVSAAPEEKDMIGHADSEMGARYGLITDVDVGRQRFRMVAVVALLFVGAGAGLVASLMPSSMIAGTPLLVVLAEDPPAVCPTKPFGQCAGMNFSQTKTERDQYNFTAGAQSLSCCPEGTSCVTFGPAWGMCMPAFGKAKDWSP